MVDNQIIEFEKTILKKYSLNLESDLTEFQNFNNFLNKNNIQTDFDFKSNKFNDFLENFINFFLENNDFKSDFNKLFNINEKFFNEGFSLKLAFYYYKSKKEFKKYMKYSKVENINDVYRILNSIKSNFDVVNYNPSISDNFLFRIEHEINKYFNQNDINLCTDGIDCYIYYENSENIKHYSYENISKNNQIQTKIWIDFKGTYDLLINLGPKSLSNYKFGTDLLNDFKLILIELNFENQVLIVNLE